MWFLLVTVTIVVVLLSAARVTLWKSENGWHEHNTRATINDWLFYVTVIIACNICESSVFLDKNNNEKKQQWAGFATWFENYRNIFSNWVCTALLYCVYKHNKLFIKQLLTQIHTLPRKCFWLAEQTEEQAGPSTNQRLGGIFSICLWYLQATVLVVFCNEKNVAFRTRTLKMTAELSQMHSSDTTYYVSGFIIFNTEHSSN